MPVEVMAGAMGGMVGTLLEDRPPQVMLKADTVVSMLAAEVVTIGSGQRADTRAMQAALIIGMAAVTGEAITGIRPMDILEWAITAWAMAIHTTGVAITVTATVGTIRTTAIGDTTLTSTDTGRP
jgi:hypothetical protein